MGIWLTSILMVGAAYLLWLVFVVALVSSLNEIKKSAWHYSFSIYLFDREPKNSCDYGKMLMVTPLIYALVGILAAGWFLSVIVRFFFNWLIWPFLAGRIPEDGFSKIYFKKVINPETLEADSGTWGISTKKFMKLSPFLWILILIFTGAAVLEAYRVTTGLAGTLETNINLVVAGVSLIVLLIIGLVKKPSVKTMYAVAKEKLCRNIPIVE